MLSLSYCFKCFICGFAMCFPGLSGASTSSLLGIYGDMLSIFQNILKDRKKGILKLVLTLLTVSGGVILFYFVFSGIVKTHPKAFLYSGSIIMSLGLWLYIKKSNPFGNGFSLKLFVFFALGTIIPFSEKLLGLSDTVSLSFSGHIVIFFCGIFLSAALILPGISFSYMLSFFGLYDKIITDISERNFPPLFFLATGIILGTLVLSSVISEFMKRQKKESDCFIIGFIVSAIINSYI